MDQQIIFKIFFIFWVILGVGSFLFFRFYKNLELKKKLWVPFIITIGIIFGSFVWFMVRDLRVLYLLVPAIAFISFLNIKLNRFCNSCGRLIYNAMWFSKMEFCPKCGAKFS
jgi:hypothetical protein